MRSGELNSKTTIPRPISNKLRVLNIEDIGVEACCGTHGDNTSEVGWIRLMKTTRIADGTVRLYYVPGERTILRQ